MDILSIIGVMKFTFLLIVTFTSWNLQMLSVYIGLFRNTNTFKYPLGSHILVVHGVIWQDKTGAGERSVVYLVFFIAQASAELRSFVVASLIKPLQVYGVFMHLHITCMTEISL